MAVLSCASGNCLGRFVALLQTVKKMSMVEKIAAALYVLRTVALPLNPPLGVSAALQLSIDCGRGNIALNIQHSIFDIRYSIFNAFW